jgi:hypothetical protein
VQFVKSRNWPGAKLRDLALKRPDGDFLRATYQGNIEKGKRRAEYILHASC